MNSLLDIKELTKFFGNFQALDKMSLTVNEGDIYGFLGPNGAGKSTTLRILLGLIFADGGDINFMGKPIDHNHRSYLNHIGALIERPDFYGNLSAYNNLKILAQMSGLRNFSNRLEEVLDLVGLLPRKNSRVRTFSQGMKQRLGIAQAILHKPKLVILDEPTNGLDPQGQADIRQIIRTINQEDKITVIFSSHILKEVEDVCNRMIIINNGRKIKEGGVSELMNAEHLQISLKTDNYEKSVSLIQSNQYKYAFENNQLLVSISENEIPILIEKLTAEKLKIYEIRQHRSLEDYFLNAINQ